jgi:glycosyltransferase involved in cell wall biosynthesis
MTKITLSVAGKFHALSLAKEYAAMGVLESLNCMSRDFKTPAGLSAENFNNRVDLAYWQAIGSKMPSLLGFSFRKKNQLFDAWMAKNIVKKEPAVLHAWNNSCTQTFTVAQKLGWKCCIERSCPHNQFQHDLLTEESEIVGVPYHKNADELKAAIEELYMADVIIAPSSYSAGSYTDPELIKKVRCITLGGNYKYKEREAKTGKGLKILMVGNTFLRKGTHYLVEAMKYIDDPSVELWVRGEVPEVYRKRIQDSRIKIFGAVPLEKLHELYRTADVFVQPSVDEGFGMTVLEALSFGLPLVVTEHVGAKDVLNNHVARTVPIRDAEALAKGILAVKDLAGTKFDDERKRILAENTWAKCAQSIATNAYGLF